jgi:hypothetical protein
LLVDKPYDIVSCSTSDIQGLAAWNGILGCHPNEVEVRFAKLPGGFSRLMSFTEIIFACHFNIGCKTKAFESLWVMGESIGQNVSAGIGSLRIRVRSAR